MNISSQALAIQSALGDWAQQNGGDAIVVPTLADFWNPEFITQSKPRVLIAYVGERIRGDFSVAAANARVDREWAVAVTRGRSFAKQAGDGLTQTKQNAPPFYDVLEQARDIIRMLTSVSVELPVDYKGIRPMPSGSPDGKAYLDAYIVEFSTANDLSTPSQTPDPNLLVSQLTFS